ncbi:MAG: VIT domain-containing protein [Myxococcota bacterium]
MSAEALPVLSAASMGVMTGSGSGFGALVAGGRNLPLRSLDVRASVLGLDVEIEVEQVFFNDGDRPIEATYIFPLPDRAAVDRFVAVLGGREIEGVLKERGQARADYHAAIAAGQRAALAEEERPDVFTMTVGNVMPGEEARVVLSLLGPLSCRDNEVTFRFPLVVGQRYVPGRPKSGPPVGSGVSPDTDASPDASRISPPVLLPGMASPVQLSMTVEIDPAGLSIADLRCSLHDCRVTRTGDGRQVATLYPGEKLNRDFILRWRVQAGAVETALLVAPDGAGDEHTVQLTVVPPDGALPDRSRDVVFILDRSGSMGGWQMVTARRAVADMIETLRPVDRFCVLAFDSVVEQPPELFGLVSATDRHRFVAVQYLSTVDARGGTEMAQPLTQAASMLTDPSRDRQLILVTDGQVSNEAQILQTLGARLDDVRVCTVGIDRGVNEGFLRRLADEGLYEQVESDGRLAEAMGRLQRILGGPVLTDVRLEIDGLVEGTQTPRRPPDLFPGVPLQLRARLSKAPLGPAQVVATDAQGRSFSREVPIVAVDDPALSILWARAQVREMEDDVDRFGGSGALRQALIETSLRFNVLCRFTAFVAIDREIANPDNDLEQVTQPVEGMEEEVDEDELEDLLHAKAVALSLGADEGFDMEEMERTGAFAAPPMPSNARPPMMASVPGRAMPTGAPPPSPQSSPLPMRDKGGMKQMPSKARAPAPAQRRMMQIIFLAVLMALFGGGLVLLLLRLFS